MPVEADGAVFEARFGEDLEAGGGVGLGEELATGAVGDGGGDAVASFRERALPLELHLAGSFNATGVVAAVLGAGEAHVDAVFAVDGEGEDRSVERSVATEGDSECDCFAGVEFELLAAGLAEDVNGEEIDVAGGGGRGVVGGDGGRVGFLGGSFEVGVDRLLDRSVGDELAAAEEQAAGTDAGEVGEVVRDDDHRHPFVDELADFGSAAALELQVANPHDFVEQQDFGFESHGDAEGKTQPHAEGELTHGSVDEILQLGETEDVVELLDDVAAGHAEELGVEERVVVRGELVVETGPQLKDGADAAGGDNSPGGCGGDSGQDAEESAFAGPVGAEQSDGFALFDLERDVIQRGQHPPAVGTAEERRDGPPRKDAPRLTEPVDLADVRRADGSAHGVTW